MRCFASCAVDFRKAALILIAAAAVPLSAQQQEVRSAPSTETFRWIDFHAPEDNDIVVWVTRALQVSDWTAIREIGVQWDAALVITSKRSSPQSAPEADTFNIWSVSLTSHVVAPLLTGVNLRIFDWQRFADGTPQELPLLYDNCRECSANTYFTALYYDVRSHTWAARWMRGAQGVAVWNQKPPSGADWTQLYALLAEGDGHVEMCTWNHFYYGSQKPHEDLVFRYDLDPFSNQERSVQLTGKSAEALELRLCRGQGAVEELSRGQDSPLCQQMFPTPIQRRPVTTPPANNKGQSAPPRTKH